MTDDDRFARAIAAIDEVNRADPNLERDGDDDVPAALLYGRRMSRWLDRLEPNASEALRLAVRAQHIERWKIARSDYPEGRAGYKRWRSDLARRHAEVTSAILRQTGYEADTVERVAVMLVKKGIKVDPEVQTLEDVACLVFLDSYFADFAAKHDDDKLVSILRKTWKKMSERGRSAALELPLAGRGKDLVERALAGD